MGRSDHGAWLYEIAKSWMVRSEFAFELNWIRTRSFKHVCEADFLREAAWVVLCSGFREDVVRSRFGRLSLAFFDWQSSELIVSDADNCVRIARATFANDRKLWAIVGIAQAVAESGFSSYREQLHIAPLDTVQRLPFVGPITSQHLLKNLGLSIAKADRHLVRLATALGFADCHEMCAQVSELTGDSVALVDTVFWRYCEQRLGPVGAA